MFTISYIFRSDRISSVYIVSNVCVTNHFVKSMDLVVYSFSYDSIMMLV